MPALVCRRCAGPLQEGAASCPWCSVGIALEHRGRSPLCPSCSHRAPLGAAWCPACGARLAEQSVAPVGGDRGCPRCRAALRVRSQDGRAITECSSCGGLWLPSALVDEICAQAERTAIASTGLAPVPQRAPEARVAYLPCPACGAPMQRRNFGGSSGVVVDTCRGHGVWLDPRELEDILAWVRAGGAERERARRIERERRARVDRPQAAPPVPFDPEPRSEARGVLELLSDLVQRLR